MNNYIAPNIPQDVLWVNNSIIKGMDLEKIKSSRTTDTYPDKTFVIKMSQIKSQRKNASITFWGKGRTRSFPPHSLKNQQAQLYESSIEYYFIRSRITLGIGRTRSIRRFIDN